MVCVVIAGVGLDDEKVASAMLDGNRAQHVQVNTTSPLQLHCFPVLFEKL